MSQFRGFRVVVRVVVMIVVLVGVAIPHAVIEARPCWVPPVDAPVVDSFREPDCRWCPGNRGLEYGTVVGARVSAVSTGRVTFAGSIAGTVYVVVRHGDGLRATYGNLRSERYDVGELVIRGSTVGVAAGRVHFGLRDGERYVDPTPFLGRLVRRVRLVPLDGTRANPPPPARLRCGDRA